MSPPDCSKTASGVPGEKIPPELPPNDLHLSSLLQKRVFPAYTELTTCHTCLAHSEPKKKNETMAQDGPSIHPAAEESFLVVVFVVG